MSNPNQEPIVAEEGTFQRMRGIEGNALGDYRGSRRFVWTGIDSVVGDDRDLWPRRTSVTLRARGNKPSIHYEFTIAPDESVTKLTAREHQINDIDGKPIDVPPFLEMLKQINIAETNQAKRLKAMTS